MGLFECILVWSKFFIFKVLILDNIWFLLLFINVLNLKIIIFWFIMVGFIDLDILILLLLVLVKFEELFAERLYI